MKNIPIFTADNGLATLILQEIPHCGRAYVLIRSVWTTAEALLDECRGFCRACGAEEVYASWDTAELPGTHAYDVIPMTREKAGLPAPTRALELEPLTRENSQTYLDVHNRCFRDVPGASSCAWRDLQPLYGEDCAFLVRQNGVCAAVAEISKTGLESIAVLPEFRGLGYELALTLLPMVPSVTLRLKVATTNTRALRLYERLDFRPEPAQIRWYRIGP